MVNACPICHGDLVYGSMHEWLITRGDVQGCPFEIQMQIYVPMNCVILHEGECHKKAQHGDEGRALCRKHINQFHTDKEIIDWLTYLQEDAPVAKERIMWMRT